MQKILFLQLQKAILLFCVPKIYLFFFFNDEKIRHVRLNLLGFIENVCFPAHLCFGRISSGHVLWNFLKWIPIGIIQLFPRFLLCFLEKME